MKKLMILIILLTTIMSCEFLDTDWDEVDKRMEEKGYRCVEAYDDGYTRTPAKCGYFQVFSVYKKFPEGIRNYGEEENGFLNGESLQFSRYTEYSEEEKFL